VSFSAWTLGYVFESQLGLGGVFAFFFVFVMFKVEGLQWNNSFSKESIKSPQTVSSNMKNGGPLSALACSTMQKYQLFVWE
jgi:hypothetical protein